MRIAWFGEVGPGGGGPGLGTMLLECVLRHGAQVDLFTALSREQMPESLQAYPQLEVVQGLTRWRWNRWYSRTPLLSFVSGTLARARLHTQLARILVDRNRAQPYDCVFQFSQMELFELGRRSHELPPIIVHPCCHAAGELRWHRREGRYARQCESWLMHFTVRAILIFRTFVQKREIRKPVLVIGPSRRFNELLSQDYAVEPERQAVLRHPVKHRDPVQTPEPSPPCGQRLVRLLFISRISVRKGVEQIVELSRRLDDLAGEVLIDVIGDRTQWSDYLGHLKKLNSRVARYSGRMPHEKMSEQYNSADGLLVPSMYEPGSLVVGEALTHGLVIVASDEVGPAEVLPGEICRTFSRGDVDAFEAQVRRLLHDLRVNGPALRQRAFEEARKHFSLEFIGAELLAHLNHAIVKRRRQIEEDPLADTACVHQGEASHIP